MKSFLFIIALCAGLIACQTHKGLDRSVIVSAIDNRMQEQQKAWNEGDLEGFMEPYWHSDSLQFIGKRGITLGWQNTLDNYKKSYPDRQAMGTLNFTNLSFDIINQSSVYVLGKWELFRTADTLSGHYSLLWKKMDGKWLIIADHSS